MMSFKFDKNQKVYRILSKSNVKVFNLARKTKRICVVDTVYTLLLYYLICGIDEDDIFIMSGGIPKEIRKNIKHIYFPHFKHSDLPDSNLILILLKRLQIIIKRAYGIVKLRIILFFKTRNCNIEVYGQGHLNFSFPLYEYENSYLIEDGLGNYMDLTEPDYSQSRLLKFFGFYTKEYYEGFGTHENIKKVYLTKPNVPKILKNKTKIININEKWFELEKTSKKKILSKFNISPNEFEFKEETVLILTEPFYEDGFETLENELNIYDEFIKKFHDYQICIKPHPRDRKNYNKLYPNTKILDKYFPIELLSFIGIEPKIVCSTITTAVLSFEKTEIYIYSGKLESDELNNARQKLLKIINNKK